MTPELRTWVDEVKEYLDNHSDVLDGSYGEPRPNRAMQLLTELEQIESIKPGGNAKACEYPTCDCAVAGPTDTIRHVCPLGLNAERRQTIPASPTDALKRKQEGYPLLPTDDSVLLQWVSEWMELARELERERNELEQTVARLRADAERLDFLERELEREKEPTNSIWSLFRRNEPITRAAIDAAIAALKKEPG